MIKLFTLSIVFAFLLFPFSCSTNKQQEDIGIIIKSNQSYRYDLINGTYTVFFTNNTPVVIKFRLTNKEVNAINHEYYALKLYKMEKINKITGNIYIEDNCLVMPKDVTIMKIQTREKTQIIQIDFYCNSFKSSNREKANKIKNFIAYVLNIIDSKPEIKKAPLSDIMYM